MTKYVKITKPLQCSAPVDVKRAFMAALGVSKCTVLHGALRLESRGGKMFGRVRSRADMNPRGRRG